MRTLALLAALLLLAFQARAQTPQVTTNQVPTQNQTGVQDQDLPGDEDHDLPGDEDHDLPGVEDHDLPGDEVQDVAVSFLGQGFLTPEPTGLGTREKIRKFIAKILAQMRKKPTRKSCFCRPQHQCPQHKVNRALQRVSWVCSIFGRQYRLCCN